MARFLLDTNVLLRLVQTGPSQSAHAEQAVWALARLSSGGDIACVTPQVIIEFWSVATRPVDVNGLELDRKAVVTHAERFLDQYTLLKDKQEVFDNWLALVERHDRKGKQVHDARLVAVMKAHGVENLLTFNVDDFAAYGEIKAVHPRDVK